MKKYSFPQIEHHLYFRSKLWNFFSKRKNMGNHYFNCCISLNCFVFVKLFTFEISGSAVGLTVRIVDTLCDWEANCWAFIRLTIKTNRQKLKRKIANSWFIFVTDTKLYKKQPFLIPTMQHDNHLLCKLVWKSNDRTLRT